MADGGEVDKDSSDDGPPKGPVPTKPPERPGRSRRKTLSERLEERRAEGDGSLGASTELMVAPGFTKTIRMFGGHLTDRGGPAREVLGLVGGLVAAVEGTFSRAALELATVRSFASIDVTFYVPERELEVATAWRAWYDDEESLEGLPDTTLALASVVDILQLEPERAARTARSISGATAEGLKRFAVELAGRDVSMAVPASAEGDARELVPVIEAAGAFEVVESLDAFEEVPPVTVTVLGWLDGARGGRGSGRATFEIVTDDTAPLDPALGARLRPGASIIGDLSPRARSQIRTDALWDSHVKARVRVVRRRRGNKSLRVEGRTLVSIEPRPGYTASS